MTAFGEYLSDASPATSSENACAVPPAPANSAATSASLSRLRAASATEAPARANSSAHARPIPCEAPVINAMRPARMLMNLPETTVMIIRTQVICLLIFPQRPDIHTQLSRAVQYLRAVRQHHGRRPSAVAH